MPQLAERLAGSLSALRSRPVVWNGVVAAASAAAIGLLLVLLLVPFADSKIRQWAETDMLARMRLIANSLAVTTNDLAARKDLNRLRETFDRVALDERIVAVGLCRSGPRPDVASQGMPPSINCTRLPRSTQERFVLPESGKGYLIGTFPVDPAQPGEHLIVVHGTDALEERSESMHARLSWLFGLAVVAACALAAAIASAASRRSTALAIHAAMPEAGRSYLDDLAGSGNESWRKDLGRILRQIEFAAASPASEGGEWTAQTLRETINVELPEAEVIVVSNREPYIHDKGPNGPVVQLPASGLVAALEPVMRACGGTWIAHGSGRADRETVDRQDRIAVPPRNPAYVLRRVWISDEEQDGYYYGMANEGLWPLCHIAFERPQFRAADWQMYKDINQRFADAVVQEAKSKRPIVLVQDYHFAVLPRMIRERLPDATIVTFWHIPWPNAETFGICPWREEIIDGLLGSSILGFHTRYHCNNFIETVDRFVESRIDREQLSVSRNNFETLIRNYPISIEWPPSGLEGQPSIEQCRATVRARFGLGPDIKLAVGVERMDYTKGIPDRLRAVDAFLAANPRWQGRFSMLQVAAPSRSSLPRYRDLHSEVQTLVREINQRHGKDGWMPIYLIDRHHDVREVFELFRAADVCIVSSLHDGMNLVAKEFVASREDEAGVLILSSFAGASRELSEALIVNPYDWHSMSEAIGQALAMPVAEQRERMRLMRNLVRVRNVYRWAGQMLLDAARLRRKQSILRTAERRQRPVLLPLSRSSGDAA